MSTPMARHTTTPRHIAAVTLLAALAYSANTAHAAPDAAAAEALIKQNNCFKCHALDKKKDGPSYRSVAAEYRTKSEGEARIVKHLTTGEKAKFPDGHEEDHKIIKVKDQAELKNLVDWILALP